MLGLYVLKSPRFAFEGQNMTFTVNVLPSCILYCDAGPGKFKSFLLISVYHFNGSLILEIHPFRDSSFHRFPILEIPVLEIPPFRDSPF